MLTGSKVEIYRNLNRKGIIYSFRSRNTGLVVYRLDSQQETAIIKNVVFNVSKAGRERVLREKRKNVHATMRGELLSLNTFPSGSQTGGIGLTVYYNPYKVDSFVGTDNLGKRYLLDVADYVTIDERGVIAWVGTHTLGRLKLLDPT